MLLTWDPVPLPQVEGQELGTKAGRGALSSSSGTGREEERELQSIVASVVSVSLGEGRRCEPKELKFCQLASAKGGK